MPNPRADLCRVDSLRLPLQLLVALLAAPALVAQTFVEARKAHLPFGAMSANAVELVDVDRDGRIDMVSVRDGQNRLWRNLGAARFADESMQRLPPSSQLSRCITSGDVDGDGDTDLIIGNGTQTAQQNTLLLNDGKGVFKDATAGRLPAVSESTTALVLVDIDGDRDLDLVTANTRDFFGRGGRNRLYVNDGKGVFKDVSASQLPGATNATQGVCSADVNGDGSPDLVFVNEPSLGASAANVLYLGSKSGTFRTSTGLPGDVQRSLACEFADADGDGDADLFIANGPRFVGTRRVGAANQLFVNNGKGVFRALAGANWPIDDDESNACAWVDLDADSRPDLVIANGSGIEAASDRILLNKGGLRFVDATSTNSDLEIHPGWTRDFAIADLDGDGDIDVVSAHPVGGEAMQLNDGRGVLVDVSRPRFPGTQSDSFAIGVADLDGRNGLDLVVGNFFQNRGFLRRDDGSFAESTSVFGSRSDLTPALAIADFDGNRSPDVIFGHWGSRKQLLINNGQARFTDTSATALPVEAEFTATISTLDFDRDGDVDLFLGNVPLSAGLGNDALYQNDGSGNFRNASNLIPTARRSTFASAAGDIDQDGRADLVLGIFRGQNRLLLGSSNGFVDRSSRLPAQSDATRGLCLGDFDRDGRLDIAIANEGAQNRLWLQQSNGSFVDASNRLPTDRAPSRAVAAFDADADGDLDLIFANASPARGGVADLLYINDGTARFKAAPKALGSDVYDSFAVIATDIDDDGDDDLIFATADRNRLLLNQHRQFDAPFAAISGQSFSVVATFAPGYATTNDFAIPILSIGLSAQPLSIPGRGTLRVDLARSLWLAPMRVSPPGGSSELRLPLPRLAGLRGQRLTLQALRWNSANPQQWHLSSLVADLLLY